MKIINDKAKGKTTKVEEVNVEPTDAKDLMAQLKASLEARKKKKAS